MKKFVLFFIVLFFCFTVSAYDFTELDDRLQDGWHMEQIYEELLPLLGQGFDAQVYSRLSQAAVNIGNAYEDKESRNIWFHKGVEFAQKAIELDYTVGSSYVWKTANIGRLCQSEDIFKVLSYSEGIQKDLDMLLNTLGEIEYESAWETLAEYYYNHPFKSASDAVSYARITCDLIPDTRSRGQLWLSTYDLLARCLYKRNWSAKRRSSEINKMQAKFNAVYSKNTEKYAFYEGKDGSSAVKPWLEGPLSSYSDRQEAKLVLEYCKRLYDTYNHSLYDVDAWKQISENLSKW